MASDPKTNNQFRIEKDALGEVRVPTNHLWGAQTERSRQNFTIGVERHRWGRPVVQPSGSSRNARRWQTLSSAICRRRRSNSSFAPPKK